MATSHQDPADISVVARSRQLALNPNTTFGPFYSDLLDAFKLDLLIFDYTTSCDRASYPRAGLVCAPDCSLYGV